MEATFKGNYGYYRLQRFKGAVYIQIIRSSKSLWPITEAHDVARKCWIL